MRKIRLHGDNIVECERIANLIINNLNAPKIERRFSSLACPCINIFCVINGQIETIELTFFPGFNKSRNDRWKDNILELLKQKGCFLDEMPDIIMTEVVDGKEEVLVAIEFCSALQAGNQAWQRSGRAYSVGRANCPYIYLLDFVKYELNSDTRQRKELRFPNPAVVYSYIAHSLHTGNFVVQAYVRAEEFQPDFDRKLRGFDESIFGEKAVGDYLIAKILHHDASDIEKCLLDKNAKMVKFLAEEKENAFSASDWETIYETDLDVIDFSKKKRLPYRKKVAEKSVYGKTKQFIEICSRYCIGIGSKDLPFALLPAENKQAFSREIIDLYSITDTDVINKLKTKEDLIVCTLKGFKPRGDDARPDRGALPFMAMLLNEKIPVLTFIFGPLVKSNARKLNSNLMQLYKENGLWKTIIAISDLIFVNAPYVTADGGVEFFYNNSLNKDQILRHNRNTTVEIIDEEPNRFQENDVDNIIHYIFKHVAYHNSFEGMCNPPGGDWSGMSIRNNSCEYRWLSLPRVSFNGKRPDHVIQLFGLKEKPVILAIESKEKGQDLETDVGIHLKNYIHNLLSFTPSVVRQDTKDWAIAKNKCNIQDYIYISVGAFLSDERVDKEELFDKTQCDMLFDLYPDRINSRWVFNVTCGEEYQYIKQYLSELLKGTAGFIVLK